MNPLTSEWVAKAEGDYASALREWRARKQPNYDGLCFHAQQCAEKYLKACLQENRIAIPKIHNLIALLELLQPIVPEWKSLETPLNTLNQYAVAFRYPGQSADREVSREALEICRLVRLCCREYLGFEA